MRERRKPGGAEQGALRTSLSLYNTGDKGIQARVALTAVAQSSIDAQYYMWASDAIGRALLDRVIAAADRGVRVQIGRAHV